MSRKPNIRRSTRNQSGFTIVELMIATVVFSVILLVITAGVLAFSKAYFKGVNSSSLQDRARAATDTITESIQFSGSAISVPAGTYFCAGGNIFTYKPFTKYDGAAPTLTNPGLWQQPDNSGACNSVTSFDTTNGKQLLAKNMRVLKLVVTPVPGTNAYNVNIRLAYGSDNALMNNGGSATSRCLAGSGSEYCATIELNTVVQKRL